MCLAGVSAGKCLSHSLSLSDSSHLIPPTTPKTPPKRSALQTWEIAHSHRVRFRVAKTMSNFESSQCHGVAASDHVASTAATGKAGVSARESRSRIRQEPVPSHHQHARGSASADRGLGDLGRWDTGSSSRAWIRLRLDRGFEAGDVGDKPPATKVSCEKRSRW